VCINDTLEKEWIKIFSLSCRRSPSLREDFFIRRFFVLTAAAAAMLFQK
jgi:hypothetical protein